MSTDSEADCDVNASDSESESKGLDVETSKSENENVCDEESVDCSQRSKLESLGGAVSSANVNDCSQRSKLESLGGMVSSANVKLKLSDSDLVWGKVSSYPWWPGQVFLDSSLASKKAMKHFKKGTFLVAYFGDCTFAWNDVSKIKPFHHHFSQMVKQSDSPEFRNAVGCALEEVSRRVEFGLSCGCVSEEAYERVKTQNVMNPGVGEESWVRYGGDKVMNVVFVEPVKLVEYVKCLACCPRYDESDDKLLFVKNRAQLLAFQQWTSCLNFSRDETFVKDMTDAMTEEETLLDCIADRCYGRSRLVEKMADKKRKVLSSESGKPEKQMKVAETCFVMRAIPLRKESEMTHTLKPLVDSNSTSKVEVVKKKMKKPELEELAQEKSSSSPDEMMSSLLSNYEDFEKFIEEMSCSHLNHDSEKASVPSDVKESSGQRHNPLRHVIVSKLRVY